MCSLASYWMDCLGRLRWIGCQSGLIVLAIGYWQWVVFMSGPPLSDCFLLNGGTVAWWVTYFNVFKAIDFLVVFWNGHHHILLCLSHWVSLWPAVHIITRLLTRAQDQRRGQTKRAFRLNEQVNGYAPEVIERHAKSNGRESESSVLNEGIKAFFFV